MSAVSARTGSARASAMPQSSTTTLSWALHLISLHPEIERRLHAEVDAVLSGRPAVHADLPDLDLTGRIITETLRLRGPGWFFTRTVTADTHLGGHLLPVGTTIAYSPYLIHHRRDLYDAPETFDPDRWSGDLRPCRATTSFRSATARADASETPSP
ncbi:MAG TPA: cytochrome P450 [Gemmatimonadales bacterium]|nr:cytochrome P450 [Gemmatimonadales bacterium]